MTITGEAGVGKTRVALEVTNLLGGSPVAWVSLDGCHEASSVGQRIGDALGVVRNDNEEVAATIIRALAATDITLVLDGIDEAIGTIAALATHLLSQLPMLRVIATSRTRLRQTGEMMVRLHPLGGEGQSSEQRAAGVSLLLDLANAAGFTGAPTQPELGAIVNAADGIPAALELLAPRLASLTPSALLTSLGDWC